MNISSLTNPIVVAPLVVAPLSGVAHNALHSQPHEAKTSQAKIEGPEEAKDKRQAALQLVNRTLTAAYAKISSRGQPSAGQTVADTYDAFEPLTAAKVANNILGFIERRLQMDVADGATQEQLQSRVEAGLAGFKKGFAEASEQLKALSMLSPEIETDIGQTYDLVLKGIDDLRSKFITATEKPADIVTLKSTKPTTTLQVPDILPNANKIKQTYGDYEYARASEFSFELVTAEGDKVTITANSSEGLSVEQASTKKGGTDSYNASASSSQTSSWSVVGDLNDDEIKAINELLGRVDTLAEQFFSGNLDEAFNQALALGYDETHIASYALHLSQVEIQQATQAYGEFAPQETNNRENNSPLLTDQLLPLGNFIKELLDALDTASVFNEPRKLLGDVSLSLVGTTDKDSEMGKRFSDFINKLFSLDVEQHNAKNTTE